MALAADRDGTAAGASSSRLFGQARAQRDRRGVHAHQPIALRGPELRHRAARHRPRPARANTFMRAPGEALGTFAVESAMDELAHELQIDPIELRASRNIGHADPVSGAPHSQSDLMLAYELGAKRFGWERRSPTPRSRQGRRVAGRHGMRVGLVSLRADAGHVGPDHDRRRWSRDRGECCARDGHGHGNRAAAARRRSTRTAARPRHRSYRRHQPAVRQLLPAARRKPPRLARRSMRRARSSPANCCAWPATTRRWPACGRTRSSSPMVACARSAIRRGMKASHRSSSGRRAATSASSAKARRPLEVLKFSMHSRSAIFCELRVSEVTGEVRVDRSRRLVRLRPHPQSEDGGQPVSRRHDHGNRHGADGRDPAR